MGAGASFIVLTPLIIEEPPGAVETYVRYSDVSMNITAHAMVALLSIFMGPEVP